MKRKQFKTNLIMTQKVPTHVSLSSQQKAIRKGVNLETKPKLESFICVIFVL